MKSLVVFLLGLVVTASASAGVVTGSAVFSGGYYTYSYTLNVSPSELDGVSQFGLVDVADDVDVALPGGACSPTKSCDSSASTVAPAGWAAVLDDTVTNHAAFSTAIPASPSSTTTGFQLYSTIAPVAVQYYTVDDLGNVQTGATIGPSAP